MKKRTMAQAFDEWMFRYIQEPERFEREFESVLNFCRDVEAGRERSYGRRCAAYLRKLMREPARKQARLRRRR